MNARLQMRLMRDAPTLCWPRDLGRPTDPLEQTMRARAQSLLIGAFADRQGQPLTASDFTRDQAHDVIAWAAPVQPRKNRLISRLLSLYLR